jgi:DNA (cytosine-5)-methyltransferase 1
VNKGGVLNTEICPTISTSSWENNCFLIETDDSLAIMEEVNVKQIGNLYPDKNGFKNRTSGRVYSSDGLSPTLTTVTGGHHEPKIIEAGYVKERKHQQDFVQHEDGICRTICTGTHASTPHLLKTLVSETNSPSEERYLEFSNFISLGIQNNSYNRVWKTDNYCGALNCTKQMEILDKQKMQYRIRKLTPRECFRLMGVDDKDINTIQTAGISNSQQYKLAGNSIVVDVLYHIFRKTFIDIECEEQQLKLF